MGAVPMMQNSKSRAPAPPDFTGAANAQAQLSNQAIQQQNVANRPNQTGPFSSSQWTQGPNGQWSQTVGLNGPLGQAASGWENQFAQQAGQPLPSGQQARDQAINAAYGQATSRLDPQFSQMQTSMEAKLANQGLTPGSQAYDAAMQNFGRERNDAYTSAMNSAIGQGTQAGNMIFQQGLESAQLPTQQLGALQGLTQQPGFATSGQAQVPQLLSALAQQYGGELNQYGANQANKNSLMSGLGGLGALGVMASDEKLKDKIERLAWDAIPGVPFATWEWKHRPGAREYGVIAQDLEKVRPDLVHEHDGLKFVDYNGLWKVRNGT